MKDKFVHLLFKPLSQRKTDYTYYHERHHNNNMYSYLHEKTFLQPAHISFFINKCGTFQFVAHIRKGM